MEAGVLSLLRNEYLYILQYFARSPFNLSEFFNSASKIKTNKYLCIMQWQILEC